MGSNPHLEHRTLPSLTSTASDSSSSEQTLCYQTGYADSTFECIFSHASPAYADAPLQLFEELFRTLKPAGTLTVSFYAPIATEIKLGEELRNKPQSDVETPHCIGRFASRAWLQAQDGADLLYMVGSFYYYTGEWKAIQVGATTSSTEMSSSLSHSHCRTSHRQKNCVVKGAGRCMLSLPQN